jgi:hypothetical protein
MRHIPFSCLLLDCLLLALAIASLQSKLVACGKVKVQREVDVQM